MGCFHFNKTQSCYSKITYETYIRIFHSLKINRILPFCNVFMERPS